MDFSTKGNIILNHCKIKTRNKEICDGSKKKYSRYTPGSNIRIISKQKMRKKIQTIYYIYMVFRKEVIKQELNFLKKVSVFHLLKFHIVSIEIFILFKERFGNLSVRLLKKNFINDIIHMHTNI